MNVGKNKPSCSHHHFYRWYEYHSHMGDLWHCFTHINIWLVVSRAVSSPLKILVSWDNYSILFPTYGKITMFQNTNLILTIINHH